MRRANQSSRNCLSRPMAPRTDGLPKVRVITPDDEEEVMALCRDLHDENGIFSLDEDKVRACFRKCYDRKGAIVGVIGPRGRIEASTCLVFAQMTYTNDFHLEEIWNHVGKKFRSSRNAEALIKFGMECSDRIGIPLFTGIVTNNRLSGKVRLYRRFLGYPAGAFFVYNAKWADGVKPSEEDFFRPLESRVDLRRHAPDYWKTAKKNGRSDVR